jgi:exonuclease III
MPAIALALLEHRADIVILSEWRRRTGGQIAGVLHDHGLTHQAHTDPGDGVNGVLVASRWDVRIRPCSSDLPGQAARRARALRYLEAELPELPLTIAAAHVPCEGPGRLAVLSAMVDTARRHAEGACVLMGDFNAWRGEADSSGQVFGVDRPSGELGLGRLAALGYVDAWRMKHRESREFTWFGHDGAGFRIDHAHVSRSLSDRVQSCEFSHFERETGISDHSMLLLDVDISPAGPTLGATTTNKITEKTGEKWVG